MNTIYLEEVGLVFITRERIRQIEAALKIKAPSRSQQLKVS